MYHIPPSGHTKLILCFSDFPGSYFCRMAKPISGQGLRSVHGHVIYSTWYMEQWASFMSRVDFTLELKCNWDDSLLVTQSGNIQN